MKTSTKHIYQAPKAPQPLPIKAPWALLGGISPEEFMRDYWQKKPLLVRGAIPAFKLAQSHGMDLESPISMSELARLAQQSTVESRLIQSHPWSLQKGPLKKNVIPSLSDRDWTLLVHLLGFSEKYIRPMA